MKKNWSRQIGLEACAALVALAMQAVPAAAQGLAAGEYKVGFITENTGAIASAGQSYWNGAQLAAEEVKALEVPRRRLDRPRSEGERQRRGARDPEHEPVHRRPLRAGDHLLHPLARSPARSSRSWSRRRRRS